MFSGLGRVANVDTVSFLKYYFHDFLHPSILCQTGFISCIILYLCRTPWSHPFSQGSSSLLKSYANKQKMVSDKWTGGMKDAHAYHHNAIAEPTKVIGWAMRETRKRVGQSRPVLYLCLRSLTPIHAKMSPENMAAQILMTAPML